ncbi:hypothetical protein SAMN05192555_11513 [Franzmannia pantelleriensis]|uniref:Tetratricopeptide repeat-containing protein n=1 Tax=Franzmannia pantelleriensis TaxID=48727 RepID=A0A1G9UB51_9GAMM|nr:hypothetical protein [Halomonas pantelleriensis]SDM57149.1 hypothetical protein SAMN05192555_11513 [Halomonas pantelleriensis]
MRLKRHLVGLVCVWLVATPLTVLAEPPLPGEFISDLERLQQQLQQGAANEVLQRAESQSRRLAGGNAADRWASALYLQLAAHAAARLERFAEAADYLEQARSSGEASSSQRDRWQYQEVGLRLSAGQREQGAELLGDWLARHSGEGDDYWRMARTLAELERWGDALEWVSRATSEAESLTPSQRRLAIGVYQRSGAEDQALALLDGELDVNSPAQEWRRAAALAQQAGLDEQAAVFWDTAWRLGVFSADEDLSTLVRLHMAAGTPARGAELLQAALEAGEVADSLAHRRLLAQAWQAARDRQAALAAWQQLAERSGEADDWLRLGQLAYEWGRAEAARAAWQRAASLGVEQAEAWLTGLDQSPLSE